MFLNGSSGAVKRWSAGGALQGATTFQFGYPLAITATPAVPGGRPSVTDCTANVDPNCDRKHQRIGAGPSGRMVQHQLLQRARDPWTFGNESRDRSRSAWSRHQQLEHGPLQEDGITEQVALTFRAEAFNLFNRVSLSSPIRRLNHLGQQPVWQGDHAGNQPRLIQLALRLYF